MFCLIQIYGANFQIVLRRIHAHSNEAACGVPNSGNNYCPWAFFSLLSLAVQCF